MLKRNYREDAIALNCFLIVLALLTFLSCGTSASNTGSVRPTQDFLNGRIDIDWSQILFQRTTRTESFGLISFAPVHRPNGDQFALVGVLKPDIPVTLVNSLGYPYYNGVTIASEESLNDYYHSATLTDINADEDSYTPLFAVLGVYNDYEVIPLWRIGGYDFHRQIREESFGTANVDFFCNNPDVYSFYHNNTTGYLLCYSETIPDDSWYSDNQFERRSFIVVYNNRGYSLTTGTGHGSPLLFCIDSKLFVYTYFSGIEGDYNGPCIIEIDGDNLGWSYDMSP